jgi:elongation factor 2
LKAGCKVYLVNACAEGMVQQVSIFMGAFREPVSQVVAGNVAALCGLTSVKAGETIVDVAHKADIVPFERVRYVSEPVLTVAVEPRDPKDLPFLLEALAKLPVEDPNIAIEVNRETGEYLLNGMGELHLEVAVKLLCELAGGMAITASQPRIVYSESVARKGVVAAARSPNKQNKVVVQVEPLTEPLIKRIEQDAQPRGMANVLAVDEQRKNLLVDCTGKISQSRSVAASVVSGFEYACRAGPLCGEPLRHLKVDLVRLQLGEDAEKCGPVEVMRGVGKAVFGAVLSAEPVLLEPVYRTVISVPTEFAGECSRILSSRRGKLMGFEQKGALVVVTGYVPVSETFGLSEELRSATSGRAFWQSTLDCWRKVPEKLALKVIAETRKRKGLPLEIPKPEMFVEDSS